MEIKLVDKNGKELTVNMTVLGKHTKEGFNKYAGILKDGKEDLSNLTEYLEWLDNTACELTGMKQDELDDLPADEKNKILEELQAKIRGKVDFLKRSKKQPG